MTRVAKIVIAAYYSKPLQRSYFAGCSDGGREALMEAQRYPEDYDGILAGAPANYWTALLATAAYDTQALTMDSASFIPPKIPTIAAAVNAACDEVDGVHDGILNDPRQCHFDPATIQCKGEDLDKCLTAAQVTALKKLYAGMLDSKGQVVYPGYLPGAEEGHGGWNAPDHRPGAREESDGVFRQRILFRLCIREVRLGLQDVQGRCGPESSQ